MDVDICAGCLSIDRRLYPICEGNQLVKVLRLFQKSKNSKSATICWECRARLKNMESFIKQVKNVQSILQRVSKYDMTKLPTFSNLSIVKNETILLEYKENIEIIKADDTVIKSEFDDENEHKCESYDYIDDFIDNTDDIPLKQDIKLEEIKISKSTSRKKKKTKAKSLDIVGTEQKFGGSKHILKKINANDLNIWLERERNSDFYEKYRFSCMECFKVFRHTYQFTNHMTQCHKDTEYVCNICNTGLSSKLELKYHVKSHYFIRECTICKYQCYGKRHMRWHMENHKKIHKEFNCDQCSLILRSKYELREHMKSQHGHYVCNECGKSLKTKRLIEKHLQNHHTKFTCKECNVTYKNKKTYSAHFNLRHVKIPPEVQDMCYCVQCDIKFDNNVLFNRHFRTSKAHNGTLEERKKVQCLECEKVFTRKTFMMNHYKLIHLNKTNFYCKLCDKYLLNSTRYHYHMNYQHKKLEKVKNKLCSVCGRGFNTNRTLANHILTHTGERPFPCEICGARFSQKHAMQSHVKHVHFNISRRKVR